MIALDAPPQDRVNSLTTSPRILPTDTRFRALSTPGVYRNNVIDRNATDTDVPPMLPPWVACVAEIAGEWFVAETQTKYEKSLAWKLLAKEFPYYLPLTKRVKVISGVRRTSHQPLFANYIFAAGDAAMRFCRESRCVLNILSIGMQKQFINELSSLEIALFGNPRLEICDIDTVGQKVRVTGGAFEGIEGLTEEFHNRSGMIRVVIRVATLGGVSLDIDRSDLELIQ